MTIYIGENIKKLRLDRELTQEALAEFLGVSFQSVSRWERGESYPDITMLPSVASFFGVTVDSLLGVSKAHNEEKINEYINLYDNMRQKDSAFVCAKFEDAVREFPGDFRILIRYMELLHEERLFNQPWRELVCGGHKKISDKIEAVYESIQKHCTDDDIRIRSKRIMITHLMWKYDCLCDENGNFLFDKAYLNRAKEIASTLPAICDSRELTFVCDREDYCKANKQAAEELLFQLHGVLFAYCFNRPPEERIRQFNSLQDLLSLICPDGSYGKNTFNRLYNYGHLGQLYHKTGNNKTAVINLKKAAEFAVELDNTPDETERIKRHYNYGPEYREMSAKEFMKTVMTEHYHLSEEFKNLSEFREIVEMLG